MRSVLFYPYDKTQPLTKQYPELARAKQFKELKSHEQLFVWLFACQSSYLMKGELKTDNKARAKAAFEEAFSRIQYSGKDHEDYCNLRLPEKIKVACEWMAKRSPDVRARASIAVQRQFDAMLSMLNEEIPEEEMVEDDDGETKRVPLTPLAKKQHVEARQKAREEMTALIPIIEEGFSVTILDGDVDDDDDVISHYIRDKKQQS